MLMVLRLQVSDNSVFGITPLIALVHRQNKGRSDIPLESPSSLLTKNTTGLIPSSLATVAQVSIRILA
jgi:hypothetical protein